MITMSKYSKQSQSKIKTCCRDEESLSLSWGQGPDLGIISFPFCAMEDTFSRIFKPLHTFFPFLVFTFITNPLGHFLNLLLLYILFLNLPFLANFYKITGMSGTYYHYYQVLTNLPICNLFFAILCNLFLNLPFLANFYKLTGMSGTHYSQVLTNLTICSLFLGPIGPLAVALSVCL